jgi:hypothetical protein
MESDDAHTTTSTITACLTQLNFIISYIAQHSRKTGQVMVNYESLLMMKIF